MGIPILSPGEPGTQVRPRTERQRVPRSICVNGKGLWGYVRSAAEGERGMPKGAIMGDDPLSRNEARDLFFPLVGIAVP